MNKYIKIGFALLIIVALSFIDLVSKEALLKNQSTLVGFEVNTRIVGDDEDLGDGVSFFKAITETSLPEAEELFVKQRGHHYLADNDIVEIEMFVELNVLPQSDDLIFSLYEVYKDGNDNFNYIKASENVSFDLSTHDTGGSIFLNKEFLDEEGYMTNLYFEVSFKAADPVDSIIIYEYDKNKEVVNIIEDINSINEYKLTEDYLMMETVTTNPDGKQDHHYEIITKDMIDQEYGYDVEYPVTKGLKFTKHKHLPVSK